MVRIFWNLSYVNTNLLAPGQAELVPFPASISVSGVPTVIRNGTTVYINDIQIRSVSNPLDIDPSCHVLLAENGNPVSWMLPSFSAREGWHTFAGFEVVGNESVARGVMIAAASLSGVSDRYIVTMNGYAIQ